ncbi:D-amino acid oxidase [Dioszegia hungarica]|uniref:D-amino acid oxidase n=1 Tax=Dioszegia hungarica TaxID=4972 RepID=A0AA38H3S7_9TREE|nr:D-amino acid oxidase [Dioszegia hungarica]KAI9633475.1 D-amino acid oxidase [Dioszegia hungarica]
MSLLYDEQIIILGSGVIGLTTALVLARRGLRVKVIARELPSDSTSQDWSSPWAGANWCPFGSDSRVTAWETEGFKRLSELIPSGLALSLPITRYAATEAGLHKHWYKNVVPDYRVLPSSDCPPGSVGASWTSLSVDAPNYLRWVEKQCVALGVTFKRRTVRHISEAAEKDGQIVVNATGLGSRTLGGVEDEAVEPIRGQIVIVRAPQVKTCVMDSSKSDIDPTRSTYIIPRPGPANEVICGGCYEVGSFERKVDPILSRQILEKCLAHFPALATKGQGVEGVDVIRHAVGFRPSRRGGPRLEAEEKRAGRKSYTVVHAYGIGPAGYQASWGMAKEVSDIIGQIIVRASKQPKRVVREEVAIMAKL